MQLIEAGENVNAKYLPPDQYNNITKTTTKFPALCIIPDTPRWGNNAPHPGNGSFVGVGGFLTSIARVKEKDEVLKYEIEVEKVTFLGRQNAI